MSGNAAILKGFQTTDVWRLRASAVQAAFYCSTHIPGIWPGENLAPEYLKCRCFCCLALSQKTAYPFAKLFLARPDARESPSKGDDVTLVRTVLFAVFLTPLAAFCGGRNAAEHIAVLPQPPSPVHLALFSGAKATLLLSVRGFEGCPDDTATLYQVSTRLLAPVAERQLFPCEHPTDALPSGASVTPFEFAVPAVERDTNFEWRFVRCAGQRPCRELGRVAFTAYSNDLLGPLRSWAAERALMVHDRDGQLMDFLDRQGVEYLPARTALPRGMEVVTLIAVRDGQPDKERLGKYLEAGAVVLFLDQNRGMPVIVKTQAPHGWKVEARLPLLSRLETDPAAQKLLVELFYMSLGHEPEMN